MRESTPDRLQESPFPRWSEMLRDHRHVLIRPIHAQDKAAARTFVDGLASHARRVRFLGHSSHPAEHLLAQITNIDYAHDMGFIAVVREDSQEKVVGVCRYRTDSDGVQCECVVTVAENWQRKGLGVLLMRRLIEVARDRGISSMYSIDSVENTQVSDLARFLGFASRPHPDDSRLVIHALNLRQDS